MGVLPAFLERPQDQVADAPIGRAFARSGAHLEALRQGSSLANEIRIRTYAAEALPAWSEAKTLVEGQGGTIAYR